MAGQPWAKLFVADLQTDAGFKRLRAEGKAVWFQAFCEMHTEDTDRISGTVADLALALALPESQVAEGINQIEARDVCEVVRDSHGNVTLISRRRRAELGERENARIRKRNERTRRAEALRPSEEEPLSQTGHVDVPATHTRVRADSDSVSVSPVLEEQAEPLPRARTKAIPADAEEVRQYALMVHLPDYSQKFFDHYESVGWRHGVGEGKPIHNWQSRYRMWCEEQRGRDMAPKKNGHAQAEQPSRLKRLIDSGDTRALEAAGIILR